MNTFELNGQKITAAEIDFNFMAELDEMGIALEDFSKHTTSFIRCYVAISLDVTKRQAADMIQEHIINGGSLEPIVLAVAKEIENSGFLKALQQKPQAAPKRASIKKSE